MKCFYHEDRDAVATCQGCGKGLCKECASAHRPCYCPECWDDMQLKIQAKRWASNEVSKQMNIHQKLVKIDEYKEENKKILICLGLGFALVIAFILFRYFAFGGLFELENQPTTTGKIMSFLAFNIIAGSLLFMIPFGWRVLKEKLDPDNVVFFWATILIRIVLSCAIGYIAFPCYMVKMIINKIKIGKLKKQIA